MGFKVGCFIGLFHPPEINLLIHKSYITEYRFANQYKMCFGCFGPTVKHGMAEFRTEFWIALFCSRDSFMQ